MNRKEFIKKFVSEDIGWTYHELKWLTEKEAKLANKERDALVKSLSSKANFSFGQNKIHIGELSSGCVICGQGYWSCMFITNLCTASCFYCPLFGKMKKEIPMVESEFDLNGLKDYIAYLRKYNFRGVGISGGECLVVYKKLLSYIREIKRSFGKNIYLWIYTNGDLVNEDKLINLKKAGLDEIRFNISARNYDLKPVELAVSLIDTVSVEIPAIPEDYVIVKKCLPKMQKIGVKYLNLHQLFGNKFNYKNYIKRGYTFLHNPPFSIFESEITALKLMRYALNKKIGLPINYCSKEYKNRLQSKGVRRWRSPLLLLKNSFEELTDIDYIRRLSIQDVPVNIKKIIKVLHKNRCQDNLWSVNDTKNEIFIHGSLLKYINFLKYNLTISYFEPQVSFNDYSDKVDLKVSLGTKKKIFLKKELLIQVKLSNRVAIELFHKLFIKKFNELEVFHNLRRNYNIELNKWREFLLNLKKCEQLEVGFPEIY